jgi:hypothetical protein
VFLFQEAIVAASMTFGGFVCVNGPTGNVCGSLGHLGSGLGRGKNIAHEPRLGLQQRWLLLTAENVGYDAKWFHEKIEDG